MDKKIIGKRVEALRKLMKEHHLDAYLVPTNDFHSSEYVSDYFKERAFISGFNGSAGTVLVTMNEAILWTDGRYFLQAASDVEGTPFELYRMGEPNVPTIYQYLYDHYDTIKTLGFDGRCYPAKSVKYMNMELSTHQIKYVTNLDLIGEIWNDRPAMPCSRARLLEEQYAGKSRLEKINDGKAFMAKGNFDTMLITSLDDIAWLLNIRGNDVMCNPVVLSYVLFDLDKVYFYVQANAIRPNVKAALEADGIIIKEYNDIYDDILNIDKDKNIYFNDGKVNYELYSRMGERQKVCGMDFTTEAKAVKNEVEIEGFKNCHIRDGVALTRFIYLMKTKAVADKYTELSASLKLQKYRAEGSLFQGLSFETICATAAHGAIIHYEPTPETDIPVEDNNFLLVDSGGQYLDGTTDVTRTIAIGKVSDEQKYHYTLVLKSHLALGDAVFPVNYTGAQLDTLARMPLWRAGLDFNHGTGHGVGHFLNVHEGPQNISRSVKFCVYPFKAGMVTSNEPGLYFEGKYGIRIENLILSAPNDNPKYLHFDTLTLAPYEVDAIDKTMLTAHEIELIHAYHERIYNTLEKYLTDDVKTWLKSVVEAI